MFKNILPFLLFAFIIDATYCADESNTSSTKRFRYRRTTSPKSTQEAITTNEEDSTIDEQATTISTTLDAETESTISILDFLSNTTLESKETSIISGEPSIAVQITTRKSLHVRNCGEQIGDDIPFLAILVHTNPYDTSSNRKRSLSKGVLISENYVLATVSSIYHSQPYWAVTSVRLGDFITWNKYANRDKSYTVEIEVGEIFHHQKKDLAMIKLKESVTVSDIIRPACLPLSDGYNFKDLKSHLCKRSHNKSPAEVTLEMASPLSTFDCRKIFARKRMFITQHEFWSSAFCAWDETGDDCAGDVGNPIFTSHNGRLFVVGLRSYAETDEEFGDPSEFPGVFVKIGSFLDWISAILSSDRS